MCRDAGHPPTKGCNDIVSVWVRMQSKEELELVHPSSVAVLIPDRTNFEVHSDAMVRCQDRGQSRRRHDVEHLAFERSLKEPHQDGSSSMKRGEVLQIPARVPGFCNSSRLPPSNIGSVCRLRWQQPLRARFCIRRDGIKDIGPDE